MPLTPEFWRDPFTVSDDSVRDDSQSNITQLANGNILVTWARFNGSFFDFDIFGQILDPFGQPVGDPFIAMQSNDQAEISFTAEATPQGGYIGVFEQIILSSTGVRDRI
jgi:hypothetical protein